MNNNFKTHLSRCLIIGIFCSVILFMFSGCGNTPEYIVSRFFEKLYSGDVTSAKRYCTKSFLDKYGQGFDTSSQFMQYFKGQFGGSSIDENTFKKENYQSEITGKTARVWETKYPAFKVICAKEGLSWKVDDFSIDFAEMMKNLNINDLKDLTPDKLKDLGRRR